MNALNQDTHALARELRVLAPPVWNVKVRLATLPREVNGDCSLVTSGTEPHYLIRVSNQLPPEAQTHILIHEWAHALSWGSDSHRIPQHGAEWGIAMSRIWQAIAEE